MRSRYQSVWIACMVLAGLAAGVLFGVPQKIAQAAPPAQEGHAVAIYFFWGDGCPHCAAAKPFLENLAATHPGVEVKSYEVWNNLDNQLLMDEMATGHGFEPKYVPTIFIADKHWEGYNEVIEDEIVAAVDACLENACVDAGLGIIPGVEAEVPVTDPADPAGEEPVSRFIDLPLVGRVDLGGQSLLLSTALIALVDGFNPCSVWVLSMLLALVVHTGSRRKILLIGLVFLTVTAAIYALFIAGLFSFLTMVSFVGWIQGAVAAVALVFALINIKDYFWYKEGVSLTISDKQKPGIYKRMRSVVEEGRSFWGVIGATVVLAAGVSLVEFSCTAGFPVLWTNLVAAQNVTPLNFGLLLFVYMLIYQLDELVIFGVAVLTLKATRLEEKQGRILKLIGGTLMLTLAAVMLINPQAMNNLGTSVLVFGGALALAGLVLLLHRRVLPAMGIRLGSELSSSGKRGHKRK